MRRLNFSYSEIKSMCSKERRIFLNMYIKEINQEKEIRENANRATK